MKKITALSSLIILSAFVFFTNTTQAEFVAGKNYTVIDSIESININSIDFLKNNLIYFNKNKNEQISNIEKYLDNVVPNINDIFNNIESKP